MKHRHWLLVAGLLAAGFAFGFVRLNLGWYANYGQTDIWAGAMLAGACLLCWTALEVASRLIDTREHRCGCGYSLRGVKCPECGKPL